VIHQHAALRVAAERPQTTVGILQTTVGILWIEEKRDLGYPHFDDDLWSMNLQILKKPGKSLSSFGKSCYFGSQF
jgi:hypothetical protein